MVSPICRILIRMTIGSRKNFRRSIFISFPSRPRNHIREKDFDPEAAERGDALFSGKAKCNNCHVEPLWTEPGWNVHTPDEVCIDSFQADRAPDHRYRTAPLAGLFTHQKGGFFHDGRFATLNDVVNHYNSCFSLGLTEQEKSDLIQYLLSL
jgi:cytochrome c peroxidase